MDATRLEQLRTAAAVILPESPVVVAYLYGSQAKGQNTPLSDVDLALLLDKPLPPKEQWPLELGLEVQFGSRCEGDFDVRIINDAPLPVKGKVVQTGVPIYVKDESQRVEFEATVRDRYFDFLPVLRQYDAAYLNRARTELKARGLL